MSSALQTFHSFSKLPNEIQIQIWELALSNQFEETGFDNLSRFEYRGSYRPFLQAPHSRTQIDMDHPYRWLRLKSWTHEELVELWSQKMVLNIAHVHHLSRHIVLSKWLKSVEGKEGNEGQAGWYGRMMKERLLTILRELVE